MSNCVSKAVRHDPHRAALDTNKFLKALYFDHDIGGALNLADEQLQKNASADRLARMIEENKQKWGELTTLKAESYLMTLDRTMELFYVGEHKNGVLYYRFVLVGDASTGYKVAGIWFQADPYPETQLRRKFNAPIVVASLIDVVSVKFKSTELGSSEHSRFAWVIDLAV
jgi:hypothetical protein